MNAIRLYSKMVRHSIRGQLQYRVNFVLFAIGNALSALIEYIGVWALFDRFGTLGQWTFREVGVFFGISQIAFAISEAVTREFDLFHRHVRTGDFDRVLLRPRSTVLQMLGADLQLMRIGRLLSGLSILIVSLAALTIAKSWHVSHYLLLIASILGGAFLYAGIIILQATSCFWTIESIEVWNCITYGGNTALQYPLDVYRRPIRLFFTAVIPLAAISYWPCSYLLGIGYAPTWLSFISPLFGVVVCIASLFVWRFGVSRYRSTGS